MIPFVGYAPDLPVGTPGIFTECENIIPYTDGFAAQSAPNPMIADALTDSCRGFTVIKKLDNTKRIFAATRYKLYELIGTAWTDRSAAGDYDLGEFTQDRARFAQFGNVTIAAMGHGKNIQQSTTGAFTAITGAPKAKVVETVNNFVFAFNYVDSTHGLGTKENGWWCSALGDESDWTPDVSTQCVAGSFLETPGPVIGAKKLGSNIIAYKERSAFIGQYVGVPLVWQWTQLPGETGALNHESIVNVGTAHYFVSQDDFIMFDGSRFVSIGNPIRQTFFNDLDPQYRLRVFAAHDRINGIIYWFYPSRQSDGVVNRCVVYNYKIDKWGRSDLIVEAAAEYIDPGVIYDSIGSYYSTWDDLPTNTTYNSTFWVVDAPVVAFFRPDHKIYTFSGVASNSSLTTGHYGDVQQFTTVTTVYPRFIVTPTDSVMYYSHSNNNADQMTQNITSTLSNNRYDMIWSARWHKFKFAYNGNMKITGFRPDTKPAGIE